MLQLELSLFISCLEANLASHDSHMTITAGNLYTKICIIIIIQNLKSADNLKILLINKVNIMKLHV